MNIQDTIVRVICTVHAMLGCPLPIYKAEVCLTEGVGMWVTTDSDGVWKVVNMRFDSAHEFKGRMVTLTPDEEFSKKEYTVSTYTYDRIHGDSTTEDVNSLRLEQAIELAVKQAYFNNETQEN